MPTSHIQRGKSGGGAPADILNLPNANPVYVDDSTNRLTVGTGTSGTSTNVQLDSRAVFTTGSEYMGANLVDPPAFGTATSYGKLIKLKTAIGDASATDVFTVTIPNAAHAATIKVTVLGSMGAGGAVGAFESNSGSEYVMSVARTAGVTTVIATSSQVGVANGRVSGADTLTATIAASSVTGSSTATQTFTIQVTVTKGAGASANHQAILVAEILNANASGITIA